jgi:benzoylformate decarboxylase
VNNRSYQALVEFGAHFKLTDLPGTQLPHLDYCGLARAQGVAALRVERCEELDAALERAFAATQPMLVEVQVALP